MASIWVRLGIALFVSGCALQSVETVRLNTAPRPLQARPAQAVEVYASTPPVRPHVDIALLRADQSNYGSDTPRLVQALAERAGEMGCDALFISGTAERAGVTGDAYLLDPGSRVLLGVCMVYLDQTGTPAPGSPPRTANAIELVKPEPSEAKPSARVDNVQFGGDTR
jgi:hypothetical protein